MVSFFSKIFEYIYIVRLPILLAVLFVIQNQVFIAFFHIVPNLYFRAGVVTFGLGMFLYGPAMFFASRIRYWYLAGISFIISVLFVSQYFYYAYFDGFMQVATLKYAHQASELFGAVTYLLSPVLFVFVSQLFLVLGILAYSYVKKYVPATPMPYGKKIILALILVSITISGYGYVIYTEKRDWGHVDRLYSRPYDLNSLVAKIGIVNYFIEDGIRLAFKKKGITPKEKEFAVAWKQEGLHNPNLKRYFGIAQNRNLIFILLESFENAVIDKKIGNQEITPNMNKLAREGFYFSHYFAHVNQGNTADAEFVTLNSLYVPPSGVPFFEYANNSYMALPALLAQNGYGTYALHGDVISFWNRANMYPKLGYQKWFTKDDFTVSRPIGFQDLGDEDFFLQSAEKIQSFQQPFMATLITLTSHVPFVIPADLQAVSIPNDAPFDQLQKDYIQSVHYVDAAVGVFIQKLKEMKLYDHSLIVILGDHGSYSNISKAFGTGEYIPDSLRNHQVPLIILAPGTKARGEIKNLASHIDVYPTVTNLLGIAPPQSVFGKDILNEKGGIAVKRKIGTGTVDAMIDSATIYSGSSDAVFEHGTCKGMSSKKTLPIEKCHAMYVQQTSNMRASDIVIRGNLVPLFQNLSAPQAGLARENKKEH